jgi:hypothetical protein
MQKTFFLSLPRFKQLTYKTTSQRANNLAMLILVNFSEFGG